MNLRFGSLYVGGYYHVFNRGVDKRITFRGGYDVSRFLLLLRLVNTAQSIHSIQKMLQGDTDAKIDQLREDPLVEILAVAIVKNHYHLIVRQLQDNGVSKFMQKLGTGYTMYFNNANERSGALFQGKYKYIEITNDQQLMRLIAYVSRNHEVHGFSKDTKKNGVWTSHKDVLEDRQDHVSVSQVRSLFQDTDAYRVQSKTVIEDIKQQRREKMNTGDVAYLE